MKSRSNQGRQVLSEEPWFPQPCNLQVSRKISFIRWSRSITGFTTTIKKQKLHSGLIKRSISFLLQNCNLLSWNTFHRQLHRGRTFSTSHNSLQLQKYLLKWDLNKGFFVLIIFHYFEQIFRVRNPVYQSLRPSGYITDYI